MSNWYPMKTAPKDGTWVLLRGRNAAGYPMVPVVVSWAALHSGQTQCWRDSASGRDMTNLISDVPPGAEADWTWLPGWDQVQ